MKRSEAISKFLNNSISPIAKLYNENMEVQVNVAQDQGVHYKSQGTGYSWTGFQNPDNPKEIWKNFRIPLGANTPTPRDNDSKMFFDLTKHVDGIGMTGWDWKNKQSLWVGYDFDSIVNHKVGLAREDLDDLVNKCLETDGVSLLRSTSGNGYHVYVFFDEPIPTETHNEHAAIARSLLSVLSVETGYDFEGNVDCFGAVLWAWHRKSEGTNGLQWLKEGDKFPASRIPQNWKDHMSVVAGKSKRVGVSQDVNSLVSAMTEAELTDEHRKVLKWLSRNAQETFYWDQDHHLMVAHTTDLKKCHIELQLKGLFETSTSGSSDKNCFGFPRPNGSWTIRRFGKGVQEHPSWVIDESAWCKTYFNEKPTFERACRFFGGLENRGGAYVFDSVRNIIPALGYLALDIGWTDNLDRKIGDRQVEVEYSQKKNKVFLSIVKHPDDEKIEGWLATKKTWEKVLRYSEEAAEVQVLDINVDDYVRHTISDDASAGWYVHASNRWILQDRGSVQDALSALLPDLKSTEIVQLKGKAVLNPWDLDNAPFEDEYPGGRVWNREGAKLAFDPQPGLHPTWDDLFDHVGSALNLPVQNSEWCKAHGIYTGGDFLRYWVASCLQRPDQQLPYLFFCGEQKTGKSTFHEAIELLFQEGRGCMRADSALKNPSGFNAELNGAVICIVEEVDLSNSRTAYNRLKDWVTAIWIAINTKYKNIFKAKNYMHWIQTANEATNVPVFDGDTRVIVTPVYRLKKEIPKSMLMNQFREEAPAFLNAVLNIELGKPEGRLGMPVLDTAMKRNIIESNFTPLDRFIMDNCDVVYGQATKLADFHSAFRSWLIENEYHKELKDYELHKLKAGFPTKGVMCLGKNEESEDVIGNLLIGSMIPVAQLEELKLKCNDLVDGEPPLVLDERGVLCSQTN